MSMDGLLTFTSVLVAILAIADPVQRRSIQMFAPVTLTFSAIAFAFLPIWLSLSPSVVEWMTGNSRLPDWNHLLTPLPPILALIACYRAWNSARITEGNSSKFRTIVVASLRQGSFDELERILDKNFDSMCLVDDETLHDLFARKTVKGLLDARSTIHVELLANKSFLKHLGHSRLLLVDNTVRELVKSPNSPWRSAVIQADGGHDSWTYLEEEQSLVERTLKDPEWYFNVLTSRS